MGTEPKNILIVNLRDTGNEAEALRQTLEYMGYFVGMKNVGRPRDLMEILAGRATFDPDVLILSCHGRDGKICMPVLDESVYCDDEPRGDFSFVEIKRSLCLAGKTIINLGCTTGSGPMPEVLSANNTYIAPVDYVEGNAALFFTIRLFYELASKGCTIRAAYTSARGTDPETELFCLYENGEKL